MKFINVILLVCIITVHTVIHIIMTDYMYDRCQTYQLSLGMSGYFFEVFLFYDRHTSITKIYTFIL